MKKHAWLAILLLLPLASALEVDSSTQIIIDGDPATRQLLEQTNGQFVLVNELDPAGNILVIGGPCSSALWELYTGITCQTWPFAPGSGIIFSLQNSSVVLVGGTTQKDTRRLVSQFVLGEDAPAVTPSANEFVIAEGDAE